MIFPDTYISGEIFIFMRIEDNLADICILAYNVEKSNVEKSLAP